LSHTTDVSRIWLRGIVGNNGVGERSKSFGTACHRVHVSEIITSFATVYYAYSACIVII